MTELRVVAIPDLELILESIQVNIMSHKTKATMTLDISLRHKKHLKINRLEELETVVTGILDSIK